MSRRDPRRRTRRRAHPQSAPCRPTILCIDDDPDIWRALELVLRNFEVELVCVGCGQQGIWSAVCRKPDLIVTDLRMPHGDGGQVVACLKGNAQTAHIPVLVLTGQRGSHIEGQMRNLGAAALIHKPVHYEQLCRQIAQHVPLRPINWKRVGRHQAI